MQRYRYQKDEDHVSKLMGKEKYKEDYFDYWSVLRDQKHWISEFYEFPHVNEDHWSGI